MEPEILPESKEPTPDPEIVEFLYVGEDGELVGKVEVAVYVDARERAIYRGAAYDSDDISYDRTEIRGEVDSEDHERRGWRAGRMRGSSPQGGLRTARRLARETFLRAAKAGFLKVTEEIAIKRRDQAEAWVRARLRALATLEFDDQRDMLSLTQTTLQGLEEAETQLERVRLLSRNLKTLTNLAGWAKSYEAKLV